MTVVMHFSKWKIMSFVNLPFFLLTIHLPCQCIIRTWWERAIGSAIVQVWWCRILAWRRFCCNSWCHEKIRPHPNFGTSVWFQTGYTNLSPTDFVFLDYVTLSIKTISEEWQAMCIKSTDHRWLLAHKKQIKILTNHKCLLRPMPVFFSR